MFPSPPVGFGTARPHFLVSLVHRAALCLSSVWWNEAEMTHTTTSSPLAPNSLVCCVPHSLLPLLCLEGKFFFILEFGISIIWKEERRTGALPEQELVCRSKSNNVYSVKLGELFVTAIILL